MLREFEICLKSRRLVPQPQNQAMVNKEITGAEDDLDNAENSLKEGRYKWATVQAYYSIFHAAKALVLHKGYMEKSHDCLLIALRELYESTGLLNKEHADSFEDIMNAHEDADYGLIYSETVANEAVNDARLFLKTAKELLSK